MTRIEAAEAVAALINAVKDHDAQLWAKEAPVRIYLKYNTKHGWIDNGFVVFLPDGTISMRAERGASAIKDAISQFQRGSSLVERQ